MVHALDSTKSNHLHGNLYLGEIAKLINGWSDYCSDTCINIVAIVVFSKIRQEFCYTYGIHIHNEPYGITWRCGGS
jgi:hypothetical protein